MYLASMNGIPSFWLTKLIFLLQNSEASLPVCSPNSVCNKVDTYGSPWVEKQCRCPSSMDSCSSATHSKDGHTISDRNRQYKVSLWKTYIEPIVHYFHRLFPYFVKLYLYVHSNLDITNKSVRPFLLIILNNSLYQM